jgi:hypothetical protein
MADIFICLFNALPCVALHALPSLRMETTSGAPTLPTPIGLDPLA